MLKKAYLEITNVCNLSCAFCPGTRREKGFLTPEGFGLLTGKLRPHTEYLYLHLMGEPLLHPQLGELLEIGAAEGFRLCLTTNGTLLEQRHDLLLSAPALHKLSVSLHSMEGNNAGALGGYLAGVWESVQALSQAGIICALRLWNIGGQETRNGEILAFLGDRLGTHPLDLPQLRRGSWKLGQRLYLEQAEKFDWPELEGPERAAGFCLGLRDQVAVLVDGTVTPCCLDHEGDIPLGNLLAEELDGILASPRARAICDGFSQRRPSEALCRRCGFAERFNR